MVDICPTTGYFEAYRGGEELVFGNEKPGVGSLSSIIEGDFMYSWGHHADDVVLSRVQWGSRATVMNFLSSTVRYTLKIRGLQCKRSRMCCMVR